MFEALIVLFGATMKAFLFAVISIDICYLEATN